MLILDATVVNVALPRIDADLGFGPAALSWVLNAYTLAFGGLLLLGGRLGDVFGRRRVFEIGLAVFTLGSVVGGLAPVPRRGWSPAARRRASAPRWPHPACSPCSPPARPDEAARNRALALFGAVTSGGMSLGLLLGGLLTDLGSWRWTLFINVPIGIAVLALTRRLLSETPRRPGRFDVVGAVTATLGAVSIVWALIGAPEHGWTSARTVGGLALGAVSLVALAVTEPRVVAPAAATGPAPGPAPGGVARRHRPDRRRRSSRCSSWSCSTSSASSSSARWPPDFAFLPLSVGIFAMSRVTPRLVARFGQVPLLMVGTVGMSASFAWLSLMAPGQGYATGGPRADAAQRHLRRPHVHAGHARLVLGGVEPEHAGSASGLLQTAQQLGGAVGLAVIVSVYAANDRPGEFLPGTTEAFLTSASFALAAFLIAVTVVRRRRPAAERECAEVVERQLEAA